MYGVMKSLRGWWFATILGFWLGYGYCAVTGIYWTGDGLVLLGMRGSL